jgi:hypothetical protein
MFALQPKPSWLARAWRLFLRVCRDAPVFPLYRFHSCLVCMPLPFEIRNCYCLHLLCSTSLFGANQPGCWSIKRFLHLQGRKTSQVGNQDEAGNKLVSVDFIFLLYASPWFPACPFRPRRWRRHVPPKHPFNSHRPHGVISQKTESL